MSDIPEHFSPISREEVYDIVRDCIGIPNLSPGDVPTVDHFNQQQQSVESLRKQQAEQAQYAVAGLLAPPAFEPIQTAEDRQYQLARYVEVLQEATRIRHNESLMKEIRLFIRQKRDEAATLLDEIG